MKERKRNRLLGFDYSRDNLYFVTSCVQDRICCFGSISNGKMHLNEYGQIAHDQFKWLEKQYAYVSMHEFVVMPNHVHAIIEINRKYIPIDTVESRNDSGYYFVGEGRDLPLQNNNDVSPQNNNDVPPQNNNDVHGQNINDANNTIAQKSSIKIKSLSELMGAYKTTTSKQIHLAGLFDFKWQRSFHDRIIRNDGSYGFIMNYIYRNPENWNMDDIIPND
jgi:REP element-mobilizing transposase RayT